MARDPFTEAMKTSVAFAVMLAEAQMVIGLRLMGIAGLWPIGPSEFPRMVTEKAHAAVKGGQAAALAVMAGAPPAKIVRAAIKPARKKTRANVRRLTRRGLAGA